MIERIKTNEEKLDKTIYILNELEIALDNFEKAQDIIKEVNDYYGSKNWFKDKEAFEKGEITKIKAGVLSEDAVWNINEDIKELAEKMNKISNRILNKNVY